MIFVLSRCLIFSVFSPAVLSQVACCLLAIMTTPSMCGTFWKERVPPSCLDMRIASAESECPLTEQHFVRPLGTTLYGWVGISFCTNKNFFFSRYLKSDFIFQLLSLIIIFCLFHTALYFGLWIKWPFYGSSHFFPHTDLGLEFISPFDVAQILLEDCMSLPQVITKAGRISAKHVCIEWHNIMLSVGYDFVYSSLEWLIYYYIIQLR